MSSSIGGGGRQPKRHYPFRLAPTLPLAANRECSFARNRAVAGHEDSLLLLVHSESDGRGQGVRSREHAGRWCPTLLFAVAHGSCRMLRASCASCGLTMMSCAPSMPSPSPAPAPVL